MNPAAARPGWKLVFRDEFDGKAVDPTRWNLRDPWGRERNRELQAYVEDAFEIKDGILRIKAQKRTADYAGKRRPFTSGMMTTYQKFSQQYGRFEIRCRIPKSPDHLPRDKDEEGQHRVSRRAATKAHSSACPVSTCGFHCVINMPSGCAQLITLGSQSTRIQRGSHSPGFPVLGRQF